MNGISSGGFGGDPFSLDDFLTVKKINTADIPKVHQDVVEPEIEDDEDLFGHGDAEHSGTNVDQYEQLQPNDTSQNESAMHDNISTENPSMISPIEPVKPKVTSHQNLSQGSYSNDNSMMEEFETILQTTTITNKSLNPNTNVRESLTTEEIIEDNIPVAGDVAINNDAHLIVPEEDPALVNVKVTDDKNELAIKNVVTDEIIDTPEEDIQPFQSPTMSMGTQLIHEIDDDIAQEFVTLSSPSPKAGPAFTASLELPSESTLQPIPPSTVKKPQPSSTNSLQAIPDGSMPGTSNLVWLQTKDHTSSTDCLTSDCPFMEQVAEETEQKLEKSSPVPPLALEPATINNEPSTTSARDSSKVKDKAKKLSKLSDKMKAAKEEEDRAHGDLENGSKPPLSPTRLNGKKPPNPNLKARKLSSGDIPPSGTKDSNGHHSHASLPSSASNESGVTVASAATSVSSARRKATKSASTKPPTSGPAAAPPDNSSNNEKHTKNPVVRSARERSGSSSGANAKKKESNNAPEATNPTTAAENEAMGGVGIAAIPKPRTTRQPSNTKGVKKGGPFLPSLVPRPNNKADGATTTSSLMSQDDSSTDNTATKRRQQQSKQHQQLKLPRLPHSSPVATSSGSLEAIDPTVSTSPSGPGTTGPGSPTKKKKHSHSRKPLYLRMIAEANERLMEEERERMEQYQRIKDLKSKARPDHQLIKEHMAKYDELMKSKQEEFALRQSSVHHNHIGQIRALRKQHRHHSGGVRGSSSSVASASVSGDDGTDASSLLSIGLSTPVRKQIVSSSNNNGGNSSARKKHPSSGSHSPGPLPFSPGHRNHHRYDEPLAIQGTPIQNVSDLGLLLSPTRSSSPPKPTSTSLFSSQEDGHHARPSASLTSPTLPSLAVSAPPPVAQTSLPDIPSDLLPTYLAPDWMELMATANAPEAGE